MDQDTVRDIEQFMYQEARLLDTRRLHDWLELWTEDCHYWVPVRTTRYPRISKAISIADQDRYIEDEISKEDELAILDEDKDSLERRVARLDTGMAWAEDPPSRTRHLITNIEVHETDKSDEVKVFSNFLMYRTRGETEQDFYVGCREDTLRRDGNSWKISRRKAVLDQNVLLAKNVSNFF